MYKAASEGSEGKHCLHFKEEQPTQQEKSGFAQATLQGLMTKTDALSPSSKPHS